MWDETHGHCLTLTASRKAFRGFIVSSGAEKRDLVKRNGRRDQTKRNAKIFNLSVIDCVEVSWSRPRKKERLAQKILLESLMTHIWFVQHLVHALSPVIVSVKQQKYKTTFELAEKPVHSRIKIQTNVGVSIKMNFLSSVQWVD